MRKEGKPEKLTRRQLLGKAARVAGGIAIAPGLAELLSACGPTPTEKPGAEQKEGPTAIPQVEAPPATAESAPKAEVSPTVKQVEPPVRLNLVLLVLGR